MDSAIQGNASTRWPALLAGLEAGVLGTVAALIWLAASSAWQRRSVWTAANLMASTFYGDASIRAGFSRSTVTGIALYFVLYGSLGVLFAVVCTGRIHGVQLLLAGVVFGLVWYYLSFGLLWKRVSPLLALLYAERPTIVGHVIFGGVLGRFDRLLPGPPPADGEQH